MKNLMTILGILIIGISSFAQIVPPYIPTNGLVAWYPFNGNANDESGNGNNPTYSGAGVTLVADRFSNANCAYYFDGAAGSYIRIPADYFPSTDRTISLWFNVPTVSNRPMMMGYGGGGCVGYGTSFLAGLNMSGLASYVSSAHYGDNQITYAYPSEPLNQWVNWIITFNGSAIEMYVNGINTGSTGTATYATIVPGTDLVFGVMPWCNGLAPYTDPNGDYLQGDLDDIAIWNRALTPVEITNVFLGPTTGEFSYVQDNSYYLVPSFATNQITISCSEDKIGVNYLITDATGRIVMNGIINSTETKIDISAFANGLYFISAENGIYRSKFVKE